MTLKYLITGATGGLGSQVLTYLSLLLPSSDYAAASSNEARRSQFEEAGIAFRVANFNDPTTLDSAFADVENMYFVWYTSLAFGGLGSDSKIAVQQAHLETETMLKESGVTYTSIREGIYTDAFPLFLQWYPNTETVILAEDGVITYTAREELGEANAKLLLKGGHENEIVLLTANEPLRGADIIRIINETTSRNVTLQLVSPEEYVRYQTENDIGKKLESFWTSRLSWFQGIAKGDANLSNPLMRELLGREPKTGSQLIRELLQENRDYTWHQNYVDKGQYEASLPKKQ
uniref:Quinone oxidoreductase 2 n=1 Tax=Talaromyces marneffei PM1 TaxID=1077442 RepID=A0A093VYE3_TALMA